MSVILKAAEYIFLLCVLLKATKYCIWSFQNKNVTGGVAICGLMVAVVMLLLFTSATGA